MGNQSTQKIPYQDKYTHCKKFTKIGYPCLIVAGIVSFIFTLPFTQNIPHWLSQGLVGLNILLILGQFLLITLSEVYLFPEAENDRIKGLIDNAFDSNMLVSKVEDYYSNQSLPIGTRKLLVNSFENSFFTYHIAQKMTAGIVTQNLLFFLFFFAAAFVGLPTNGWLSLIQIFISPLFLIMLIKHLFFTHHVRMAFECFQRAFTDSQTQEAYALYALITYEKALSGYANTINSKIYLQLNDVLSKKWEDIKRTANIT